MRELDDKNDLDRAIKEKIGGFCGKTGSVFMTRTAERDSALIGITKLGILEGLLCHIQEKRTIYSDFMDNGDSAWIVKDCVIEQVRLYVKLKFAASTSGERMIIISAHPDRRW